jgi:hypothetical protein
VFWKCTCNSQCRANHRTHYNKAHTALRKYLHDHVTSKRDADVAAVLGVSADNDLGKIIFNSNLVIFLRAVQCGARARTVAPAAHGIMYVHFEYVCAAQGDEDRCGCCACTAPSP